MSPDNSKNILYLLKEVSERMKNQLWPKCDNEGARNRDCFVSPSSYAIQDGTNTNVCLPGLCVLYFLLHEHVCGPILTLELTMANQYWVCMQYFKKS